MTALLLTLVLSAGPEIWAGCEVRQFDVWAAAVVAEPSPVVTWPEAKPSLPTCSTGNCSPQKPKASKPMSAKRLSFFRRFR